MKLVDVIPYLVDENKLDSIYDDLKLNRNSEEVIIFMKNALDIESEISFFDYEDTEGEMEIERDNQTFIYFFSIDSASELIIEDLALKGKGLSDLAIANRLLEYRIKDA